MPPLVTIMIPTYNQASVIGRAIMSALAQDYPNLEVIVADDNSPDDTSLKVAPYLRDSRLQYIKHSTNLGRVKNYKITLEKYAGGQWVVNLDGDDYYCDNTFISQCIALIENYANEEIVFVQGGKIKQKRGNQELSLPPIKKEYQLLDGQEYFLRFPSTRNFSHMSTIYNRQLALKLDFYRWDISSADLESFLRLALLGKVILVKKAFGVWVEHENNASNRVDFDTQEKNLQYIDSVSQFASERGIEKRLLTEWKDKMISGYYQSLILKVFGNKSFPSASNYFFKLFKRNPKIIRRLLFNYKFLKSVGVTLLNRLITSK